MHQWKNLEELYEALVVDTKIKEARSSVSTGSSSLRHSKDYSDGLTPKQPSNTVIHHPLIAFSLAIPRTSTRNEQFSINNGDRTFPVTTTLLESNQHEPIKVDLPCCKQSRVFCILLLHELSKYEFTHLQKSPFSDKVAECFRDNIELKLGTNYTAMAEEFGLARSGSKDKDEFFEHIVRVKCCVYGDDPVGMMDDVDGAHHFSFGNSMNVEIINAHKKLDSDLFAKHISALNAHTLTALGTTYAIDLYLIVLDQISFNIQQESDLLTWEKLFALNGSSLKRKERYVENMRDIFYQVNEFFPETKLTSKGIRFFPD